MINSKALIIAFLITIITLSLADQYFSWKVIAGQPFMFIPPLAMPGIFAMVYFDKGFSGHGWNPIK